MKNFPFFTIVFCAVIAAFLISCNQPGVKKQDSITFPDGTSSAEKQGSTEKQPLFSSDKKSQKQEIDSGLSEVEAAEANYPEKEAEDGIVFTLPEPREALIPPQTAPPRDTSPRVETRTEPVQQPPPPVPATAATQQPPPKEAPKRESPPPPPPPPPPVVRPSEPVVSPPPEDLSLNIPSIPFEPVSVLPVPHEGDLPYSRTITVYSGQYLEIPFRGAGWVYLGEFGARRGVSYDSRRMEPEGMTFVFRADTVGSYSLKFNLQDFVRNYILNDYVKVIVEEPPMVTGSSWSQQQQRPERVVASPRWPLATDPQGRAVPSTPAAASTLPEQPQNTAAVLPTASASQTASGTAATVPASQAASGTAATVPASQAAPSTQTATISQTPPAAMVTPSAVEDLLKLAREEYNAGRIAGALQYLDQFVARYPGGSDEAFWLYGQSLEANNEATRDIRLALDYYRRLTNEYPQSSRYSEARRRIAYLERFYFNIQ